MKGLDAWITGNYGEDHPDNQPTDEDRRAADKAHERGHERWQARRAAWAWVLTFCNGNDNIGTCPKCGDRVQVLGSKVTMDGRLIASCGDAFTITEWEA